MTEYTFTLNEPVVLDRQTWRVHRPTCWLVNGGRAGDHGRYAWLDEGKVIGCGDPHDLYDAPCRRCFRSDETPWTGGVAFPLPGVWVA